MYVIAINEKTAQEVEELDFYLFVIKINQLKIT